MNTFSIENVMIDCCKSIILSTCTYQWAVPCNVWKEERSRWCFLKGVEYLFLWIYSCTFFHLRGTKCSFLWDVLLLMRGRISDKNRKKGSVWHLMGSKQCVLRVENSQIFLTDKVLIHPTPFQILNGTAQFIWGSNWKFGKHNLNFSLYQSILPTFCENKGMLLKCFLVNHI